MGTITKLEIHFSNVGTITKLEILLLQCGNYYKVRNPTSPMWELLQS
ncbi:hypothetical protein LEP1GSC035_0535 [Leptospira noguchii str. 2007001578]|uniref:Uncharacterized protein n=1 Tax=Leptospira noguchii str. 2007001578 TaxID=1049974 RepID=A0ABN0IUZ0_9LEPT|nr:hypothetical protein LEP1GSC035_0535 [Leptospira noguchii str. 2007001578]